MLLFENMSVNSIARIIVYKDQSKIHFCMNIENMNYENSAQKIEVVHTAPV